MRQLIEIRTLTLKPGTRDEFHRIYVERSLPLLKKWKHDVVAHGPSLHDENTYFVIRRFDSLLHRDQSEDEYYGSGDWRKGPREPLLALIESYVDAVMEVDEVVVDGLRTARR
ncbi:MAG: NIPSNAP family protein [Anaerolineae bacterium]